MEQQFLVTLKLFVMCKIREVAEQKNLFQAMVFIKMSLRKHVIWQCPFHKLSNDQNFDVVRGVCT